MKYPLVLTFVACVALLTGSQTPSSSSAGSTCTLTPQQAPEIRGLRLGMSAEQLLTLFPDEANRSRIIEAVRISKQPELYGVGNLDLVGNEKDNPRFSGVNYFSIRLLDERVTSFHIGYKPVEWKSVDQFVTKLSEGLRLPNLPWERGNDSSVLKCKGFKLEAYVFQSSGECVVRVMDTSVNQIVEDRKEVDKEKARQAFRP
ncbi:MAG TPA: hypothetical protein VFT02_04670 [Pyrinomonadaceae bacterium]|nr:hypothetical protein [Pyrinomonadaceae bacterium]